MTEHSRLDETTYDASQRYLKSALEHMLEAGRSVRELSEFALDRFGTDFLPYLRQFLHDVGHGRVSVEGLTRKTQAALSGHTVSSAEREHMIREAAYLRAEARGFCGGSPEQDWIEAEQEVDLRLARGPGLVLQGGRALTSVASAVEQELDNSKQVVTRWLDSRFPARKARGQKQPASRTPAAGSRATKAPAAGKKADVRKAADRKQAAAKQTVGKKAAGNKTVAKKAAATRPAKKKSTATRAAAPSAARVPARKGASTRQKTAAAASRKKSASKKRATSAGTARKPRRGKSS
ncbi:MAG: DUF2934 domain-containing protein [Gammaproteobacteria bacterium]|jgi:hypothetical protein